ncbi:MAG: penicillin-binding protein activator [Pseudomonadota bacterium]
MILKRIRGIGRHFRLGLAGLTALALTACTSVSVPGLQGGGGNVGNTVQVALLVPSGASDGQVRLLAQNLTNAAQLGVSDLNGINVDLRVYDTQGTAGGAAQAASLAASEGAEVILGPLFARAANGAGLAVRDQGLNVLSFSNNPAVAGGNVFILGPTFGNTARRMVGFANRRGLNRYMVVYGQDAAEQVGRDAIVSAVQASGGTVIASQGFALSQQGVISAAPQIANTAENAGANLLFLTSGPEGALPFLVQYLPENGLTQESIQYAGLTRWDVPTSALSLPGLQGGWFAVPDPGVSARFNERYSAAYGSAPNPVASLAYDGIAAIGAAAQQSGSLSAEALTRGNGFAGATGVFRFLPDGSNQRGLAIATIENNRVIVIDPAPRRLGGAGF